MRFRNIKNWKNPDQLKGLLFFAQRMEELTFEYTLDSFRSPTTNAPYLLKEILRALEAHEEIGLPLSSVQQIFSETETRLHGNKIVSEMLGVRLENYLNFDHSNVAAIKSATTLMSKELEPRLYALKCFELLKIAVDQSKKSDIEFLCRELVTTLLNTGFSSFFINRTVVEFFFKNREIVSNEDLVEFIRIIFPHIHTFEIALKIISPLGTLDEDTLNVFNISFRNEIPENFSEVRDLEFMELKGDEKYLVVSEMKAFDNYSAVDMAKSRIARVHDLYGLFHHKGSYIYGDSAHVKQKCCSENNSAIKLHINRMHFVDDNKPKDAARKLDKIFRTLKLPRGEDREKFFRVIEFHGISSKSDTVENQLINLWTSLETLVPARRDGSIIAGVTRGVLPFIGLSYVRRIFERLTFDIVRWNRRELSKALKKTTHPEKADLVERVFCLVTAPENEAYLAEFLGRLLNFELLRYRIYTLNQKYSKGKNVRDAIENHQKRVGWQLHRIYRTRNSIVHSGETPKYTDHLVTNAHDYFDQVFSMSSEFCSLPGGFNTYSECFDFAERLYKQYRSDIESINEVSAKESTLILWKNKPRPKKSDIFYETI